MLFEFKNLPESRYPNHGEAIEAVISDVTLAVSRQNPNNRVITTQATPKEMTGPDGKKFIYTFKRRDRNNNPMNMTSITRNITFEDPSTNIPAGCDLSDLKGANRVALETFRDLLVSCNVQDMVGKEVTIPQNLAAKNSIPGMCEVPTSFTFPENVDPTQGLSQGDFSELMKIMCAMVGKPVQIVISHNEGLHDIGKINPPNFRAAAKAGTDTLQNVQQQFRRQRQESSTEEVPW